MKNVWCAAALAATATLVAAPVHAQDGRPSRQQTTQRNPPPAPAPAPAPAPTANPSAQPAPAPQPIRTEILAFDNWSVTCREFADKRRICTATLQVVQQQNNQVLFVWIVGRGPDNKLVSVLQTPTGVTLTPGVEVKPSKGAARKATFVNCDSTRCEANLDMDDAFIRDGSASDTVEATVFGTNGQGVKFTLPFTGFDKAMAALR